MKLKTQQSSPSKHSIGIAQISEIYLKMNKLLILLLLFFFFFLSPMKKLHSQCFMESGLRLCLNIWALIMADSSD